MHEALELLLADGVIEEVVARLKSGKEADVYVVSHGGRLVAAKIYKERNQRNFKNNAGYKEGRAVRNSRTARAIAKGSKFGQAAAEDAWKATESEALSKLHAAGVRVPAPVMFYEGVLLMELVTDGAGQPAARIVDALLDAASAGALYKDLRQQVVKMLCCDIIHGDLSAYNILLSDNGPTVIDFPQIVAAAANSQAEFFFRRDLDNLRLFFASYDRSLLEREGDTAEIWRAYTRRELSPDFEPSGRGVPGGGRGAHTRGPGRAQPHHSREFEALVREVAPPAPAVEEDEFAILRQGGGERPKVALAKQEPRGRGPRRGGGGFGGGRPPGPPRAQHGGGGRPPGGQQHAGPRSQPATGGRPQQQGAPSAHGGKSHGNAPQGPRQEGAGRGGPRQHGGAPAQHAGPPGGAAQQQHVASHRGTAQQHAGAPQPPGAPRPQHGRPEHARPPREGGQPQHARPPRDGAPPQHARSEHARPPREANGGPRTEHRPQSAPAHPHAAGVQAAAQGLAPHARTHAPRPPRTERGPGGDPGRAGGRPQGPHGGGHAPHGRQGPARHEPHGDRPHGQQGQHRGQRPAGGRGPAVSYVARGPASSNTPSDEG